VIYVGIDDTDIVGSPGTNQLARLILKRLGERAREAVICRHQLFFDPRVPYTSKNGSASIQLPHVEPDDIPCMTDTIRAIMRGWYIEGSDPGLCVAAGATQEMMAFGQHCKGNVVTQPEARAVAGRAGCHLEGLGGTEQGIIGALAAVGLVVTGEDGRIVHLNSWPYPDEEFTGVREIDELRSRGVAEVRQVGTDLPVTSGPIDIGKHLRPNRRGGRIVMFVEPSNDPDVAAPWHAIKLP
jgi:hypothetical protein